MDGLVLMWMSAPHLHVIQMADASMGWDPLTAAARSAFMEMVFTAPNKKGRQVVQRASVSNTETACRVGWIRAADPASGPSSRSATRTDSTDPCSATDPLDTAGAWMAGARRDLEPELHLGRCQKIVTDQMNHRALKPAVSTTETVCRPLVRRVTLWLEFTCLSATLMDITHPCSVTDPLDFAGVWTAQDRRELEPVIHLVHNQETAASQMDRTVLKPTVSTIETVCRPLVRKVTLSSESTCLSVTMKGSIQRCSVTGPLVTVGA